MNRGLFGKLLLTYLVVAAGLLLAVGVTSSIVVQRNFYAAKQREVHQKANRLAREMGQMWQQGIIDPLVLQRIAHFQEFTGSTVWIVDLEGNAFAVSTGGMSLGLISVVPGPFHILAQGTPWSVKGWNDEFQQHMLSMGIPLPDNMELAGIVVHTPLLGVRTTLAHIQNVLWQTGLVAFVAAIVVGLLLSRHITIPLKRMTTVVTKMADGEFGETVTAQEFEEVRGLARAFNNLSRQLHTTLQQLTHVERLRTDLVTNVSHELRTPLTGLRGFLELASDPTVTPEQRQQYLAIAMEESLRLTRLTEDLLEAARLENKHTVVNVQPTDINKLLTGLLNKVRPKLAQAELSVDLTIDGVETPVHMDAARIEQVILNLVDNARRHTPPGGQVTVGARIEGNDLRITVADTGEGIQKQDLPFIWERFFKGDRSRRQDEGSGLGLVIAREIVESHHGTIDVVSAPGKGTTFTVKLPLSSHHESFGDDRAGHKTTPEGTVH